MRQLLEQANQFVTDADGRVAFVHGEPASTSGQVGTTGDVLAVATYGMSSIAVVPSGVGPTVAFEVSFDGGATWVSTQMWLPSTQALVSSNFTANGVNAYGEIPPGATNFRVRATSTASACTVTLLPSSMTYRAMQLSQLTAGSSVALSSGAARIGFVSALASGQWLVESTTTLGATGTFTGVARDLTVAASGSFVVSSSSQFKEFRALAVADVAGTLNVEVSPDSVTWYRVRSIAAVAVGSAFVADVSYAPVLRYARIVYVNGASNQASFIAATAGFSD